MRGYGQAPSVEIHVPVTWTVPVQVKPPQACASPTTVRVMVTSEV
jgi:hypothetical protein